jgi:hypothetical protein
MTLCDRVVDLFALAPGFRSYALPCVQRLFSCLLTTARVVLTGSLLITHRSSLIAHRSSLVARCSLLVAHCSLPVGRCQSQLDSHPSQLDHYSVCTSSTTDDCVSLCFSNLDISLDMQIGAVNRLGEWHLRHRQRNIRVGVAMLAVTLVVAAVTAQALNYLGRPRYVPHSVAAELGIAQECLGFLHYPDPYATVGLAQPLPEALEMGLMPGRRLVWSARRRTMRCWHPDKIATVRRRGEAAAVKRRALIVAEVEDALWKFEEGAGPPVSWIIRWCQ